MKKETIYRNMWYLYLFLIGAVIVYTIISFWRPYNREGFYSNDCHALTDGWDAYFGEKEYNNISLPLNMDASSDIRQVSLSRVLPQNIPTGWYLSVPAPINTAEVYIGEKKVMNYQGPEGFFATGMPASEYLFVMLKQDYAGKILTVSFYSQNQNHIGRIEKIYMGDHTDIVYRLVAQKWTTLLGGLVLMIFGIILLILRFFMKKWVTHRNDYFFMGIYVFLIGIWFFLVSGMAQLIFEDIAFARALEFFTLLAIPVPVIRHIDSVSQRKYHTVAQLLCYISIFSFILFFTIVYVFHKDFLQINWINLTVLGITIVYVLLTFFLIRQTDRKLYAEIKWLFYANLFLGAGAILEIADAVFYAYQYVGLFMFVSSILYCVCAVEWGMLQIRKDEADKEKIQRQTSAKSEFLANMSHEIRTPVNAVLGINDMLRKESREPKVVSYAKDIESAGRELLMLINKILDSSKLESGRMNLAKTDYSVGLLIDDLNESAAFFYKPEVKYIIKNNPGLPSVLYGDEPKICTLVTNIIENAFKYTQSGAVMVSIDYKNRENGDFFLIIRVRDTGRGMNEITQKNIFHQFARPTYEAEGTGLGLSISWNLVQMMNGKIAVESADGIGSMFTVEIPQEVILNEPLGAYDTKMEKEQGRSEDTAGIFVLLVDDELMNLKIAKNVLNEMGIRSETAQSGAEAIQKTTNKKYDAILMDYMLPEMNGEETFIHIRKDRHSPNLNTPVIMLTAQDNEEFRNRMIKLGFSAYLLKPLTQKTVADALNQAGVCGGAAE
ncbi:MAG: response regulator [Butyrivibrio sp.]|nr:response regulator [Butyrivibrio sp.]